MQNNRKVGEAQETRAVFELEKLGYKILEKNFRCKVGEIDIIAETDKYIVFVEVKTRNAGAVVSGVEATDAYKQRRIMLTAQDFMRRSHTDLCPRFDLAEVTVTETEDSRVKYSLNYIENAII